MDSGLYRLGGGNTYAAAERRETGKSNDLCSSLDSSSESPDCYENSDLRSKQHSSAVYILLVNSKQIKYVSRRESPTLQIPLLCGSIYHTR